MTTAVTPPGTQDELPELMTRQQLSDFTGIAVGTLAKWAVQGEERGPRMTKLGAAVRYRREDVRAWLEANRGAAR